VVRALGSVSAGSLAACGVGCLVLPLRYSCLIEIATLPWGQINNGKSKLGKAGRLIIRTSGTETVIRVMADGDDEKLIKTVASEIVHALSPAA
jgi:phosphomannomutase